MELQHQFTVPADVGTTWDTLMDLAGVASCFPGATVTSVEGDSFDGTVKVKLGPIALLYTGSGHFVSRDDDAHRAVLDAKGKDKRGNGTAGAKVTISCTDAGRSTTAVEVGTDLNVTGKPAQFGRGVMQDVSDKLLQQFVSCLEQRFAKQPEASGAPVSSEPPESSGETPPATDGPAPADAAAGAAAGAPVTSEPAAVGSEAAPAAGAPAPSPAPASAPSSASSPAAPTPAAGASNVHRPAFVRADAGNGDDALDLGATVLPVLLRSYAPHLLAGAVGFVLGVLIARSRRR